MRAGVAGDTLGRYRLLERIGAGGMGEVWKAHDARLDRTVAIKMLLRGALGPLRTTPAASDSGVKP